MRISTSGRDKAVTLDPTTGGRCAGRFVIGAVALAGARF